MLLRITWLLYFRKQNRIREEIGFNFHKTSNGKVFPCFLMCILSTPSACSQLDRTMYLDSWPKEIQLYSTYIIIVTQTNTLVFHFLFHVWRGVSVSLLIKFANSQFALPASLTIKLSSPMVMISFPWSCQPFFKKSN